ncbi:MAG: histidine phosphatase family protein [Deltaproteobacteria bacterium]|nr:histidine phosphatase family protein [Deltaproteobacteria bacterium]
MTGPFIIPEPTLRAVREAPPGRATVLLIRHSARGPIPAGEPGNDVLLLPEGKELARDLGRLVRARLRTVHASPVRRCIETAESIVDGAEIEANIVEDRHLGHPGVYVEPGPAAWATWQGLGHERVMAHLVAGDRLAGLADPVPASRRLVGHVLATAAGAPGVHLFVTHDSLVTTAAAHCLGQPLGKADWPWYLEALVLLDGGGAARTASYRRWTAELPWP